MRLEVDFGGEPIQEIEEEEIEDILEDNLHGSLDIGGNPIVCGIEKTATIIKNLLK